MRLSLLQRPALLAAAVVVTALPTSMSDPVGVYAIVDRVVLSPATASAPMTIQIWGTFATSDQKPGDHYHAPAKGYLYYKVNPSDESATRNEWNDIQTMAGKKTMIGFGMKWQREPNSMGRVRCATQAPAEPDLYPVGNIGVVKVPATRHTGWDVGKKLLDGSAPDAPCAKAK
jgi:hypothetical protein